MHHAALRCRFFHIYINFFISNPDFSIIINTRTAGDGAPLCQVDQREGWEVRSDYVGCEPVRAA